MTSSDVIKFIPTSSYFLCQQGKNYKDELLGNYKNKRAFSVKNNN